MQTNGYAVGIAQVASVQPNAFVIDSTYIKNSAVAGIQMKGMQTNSFKVAGLRVKGCYMRASA
jgi:hypothetical protein